jgi:hypothetical protein
MTITEIIVAMVRTETGQQKLRGIEVDASLLRLERAGYIERTGNYATDSTGREQPTYRLAKNWTPGDPVETDPEGLN